MRRPIVVATAIAAAVLGVGSVLALIAREPAESVTARRPAPTSSTTSSTATTTTTAEVPATTSPPPPPPTAGPARATTPRPAAAPFVCPTVPERAKPPADRSQYVLRVEVKLADNAVEGDVTVRFTPDRATDRVVFRLWPNGPRLAAAGANLNTGPVRVGGHERPSRLDGVTVLVVDTGPLDAGRTVELSMPWRLTLPGRINDRISRDGDAVRLGSFFPILAWEPGVGWATDPPSTGFAEASTTVVSDFTASVTVPAGLSVLASGVGVGGGRYVAEAAPDFALSIGRFATETRRVNAPNPVDVTVGVHAGVSATPREYMDKVARALTDFGGRFGAYPWPSYTLAITPNLRGGIEYPMHVMQGPGTLARTTSHEVGHQWFYALVGSNQGRDPWLDEGLASWAEFRFENTLAAEKAKSIPTGGRGRVGEPMTYWESRQSIYYRSVYVQGAQAVAALGPPDAVDCALRHYVARSAYRVARQPDLAAAMRAVFPGADAVLARYGVKL